MNEQINDYYEKGLLIQVFEVERNMLIWESVADEVAFLKTQKHEIQLLYSYIQQSSQVNFILSLGKLFDNPSNKYPTRCMLSFLKHLDLSSSSGVEIIETTNTKKLLKEFNCPSELIEAVDDKDKSKFPKVFSNYYLEKYNDPIFQDYILSMKSVRDKIVAHNEAIDSLDIDFSIIKILVKFVLEVVSIFGMAYYSTSWGSKEISLITKSAERNSFFVKYSIMELKKKIY